MTKSIHQYFEVLRQLTSMARSIHLSGKDPKASQIQQMKKLQEEKAYHLKVMAAHDYKPRHG